jgi:K(+)-stimulated pyrophosphate-energized sodium pump
MGQAAAGMADEINRQLPEIPGPRDGTAQPDNARCMAIASSAALHRMIALG